MIVLRQHHVACCPTLTTVCPNTVQSVAAEVLTVRPALTLAPAIARACLPYWMEMAAWAAALLSDATAAAMGRLPSSEPPNPLRSKIDNMVRGPYMRTGIVPRTWVLYTGCGWMPQSWAHRFYGAKP